MWTARLVAIGCGIACLWAISAPANAADPELVVSTASGRQFRGALDHASNADQLILRDDGPGITLRRTIRWERVTAASIDGVPQDVAKLRKTASERTGNREQETGEKGQRSLLQRIEMRGPAPTDAAATEEAAPEQPAKVAMVAFDPAIVNWDADVETDGIMISVAPLDIDRRIVPISGTLEVELFAQQRRKLELAPESGGDTLELVERWTRAITPDDFGPSGVRLRLPFGAVTPELQPNWTAWHYGLVHVRLAVPGHGVFEDTRDGVRIRPWAPNRDRLEMKTGQRFLSTENLGRRE